MLEGAVARLLNHLLGKYVVDLDIENLNVGIFSGHVQLTDLKLKTEALYELGLPIEVKAGTVGKIWLQIPWTTLWSQPVVVNIEDLHIICGPLLSNEPFDPEKNKRLIRAFKRKLLADLDTESHIIGGPNSFSDHLVSNILNSLQFSVTNVHLRYEDLVSYKTPISAGLCIGNIRAERTNSKWKASKPESNSNVCYYLIKVETLSTYWNCDPKMTKWNLPSEYYSWRNAMSQSLQYFAINDESFDFVLKPMTTKFKITMNKSNSGNILKCLTEVIVQDCNLQLSKEQYDSILAVKDSLQRNLISWEFLASRPKEEVLKNPKLWWKYAYSSVLQQRVRPYTWTNLKKVREYYRGYMQTYKQIILNPNDTELKLDLQKFEDNLSIVNIVIARQHARLLVQSRSLSEKNFWSMLPSPERTLLCKQIGFYDTNSDQLHIEQQFKVRMGNITLSLISDEKEILLLTLTQTNFAFLPNLFEDSYKFQVKIEGIIMEGSSEEEQLTSIMASEHLSTSPAYIFKADFEKFSNSQFSHKLNMVLDSIECLYNRQFFDDLMSFLDNEFISKSYFTEHFSEWPNKIRKIIDTKLSEKWDFSLNIKIPFIVIPEFGSFLKADNILVVDLGSYIIKTELCQSANLTENATQMEMEEQLYSKLLIECSNMQILFCQNSDNWKDERKEKDTDLHIVPKTAFSGTYALCTRIEKTIPKYKFNLNFYALKINLSERNCSQLLKFFSNNGNYLKMNTTTKVFITPFPLDEIDKFSNLKYLLEVETAVSIKDSFIKIKKTKTEKNHQKKNEKSSESIKKEDMNEAWARYVDLPGLEDNISPNNSIIILLGFIINEFTVVFSRSSDSTDRQYLMFRLGLMTSDIALMTYGPAYQISVNSILLTDKLHTNSSGQYLDLLHSPFPSTVDVITILYRKVSASCPDFWSHFHGVETSLVADFGTIHALLHQEAIHTLLKYSNYLFNKIRAQTPISVRDAAFSAVAFLNGLIHQEPQSPVPPGSIKFSHSARLGDINVRVCDSDFDIVNIQLSGLEMDFLFRANERFVFRSYLSKINIEHLSEITLYNKVLSTDEDRDNVFELKYVRQASHIQKNDINNRDDTLAGGSFKLQISRIHLTLLYKLIVQIQRFIVNLEALPYINKIIEFLYKSITNITETLKANTRINLAINICGPVFLFPQKSSSPNVMIIDTGNLFVENFFKEYSNDVMENILLKWTGMTVTRGVMTLEPAVRAQETLIEPMNLNFDIKRYTNIKSAQKFWDIDGALDSINITLGQKDISTILSIYKDNIGEGKLLDLLPDQIKVVRKAEVTDETVKTLEAFFCEPKQKNIVAKFALDEIAVALFFNSAELLSSPIRDLNHGLCKMQINDVNTTFTVYTDGSLDGKLSADGVFIEEIGPDANIFDKGILKSPIDDNKNNNCNITINRAPIVDVTFHQNKTGDKSADIIIGRLSLSLSVPFCEKLALFVLECLPKDNWDLGIINHGYECDTHSEIDIKEYTSSLTVSIRINKPEFIFIVETTSNKKRYFITHTEILSDYSRHGNRLNLVVSLSGLHSLFYDIGAHSNEPYLILKQCDLEFSKCYSEEKGKKIIASVSSIYVQVCSRVVHSLTDVLNDITEHFKVPEIEKEEIASSSKKEEELWEPKKIENFSSPTIDSSSDDKLIAKEVDLHEILLIPKFDIVLIFELEETQVILIKSTLEVTVYDWSSLLNSTCEVTLQANYFNENLQSWEPFIDPVVIDEKEYKPWDILIKIFQDKSLPVLGVLDNKSKHSAREKKYTPGTTEDEDSGEDMMYLEPINPLHNRNSRRVKTSLSTFLDDSDSENEDGAMEKLAAAISDLFTGDWNESEDSDYIHSSEGEDDSDDNVLKPKSHEDKIQQLMNYSKSTYILIDAKETLNISITPTFLKVLSELLTIYSNKTLSVVNNRKVINVINDIGPQTKLELYEKRINDSEEEEDVLVCVKTFENQDSVPNSPSKTVYYVSDFSEDINEDKDSTVGDVPKADLETSYDFVTLSSLQFPPESTSQLYEKINNHFIKVFIPNCSPIQTNCPKKSWQKLMKIPSSTPGQKYYLAAKHKISKNGRKVLISSPLQVKNETCFALSVLYQPSVLQQLNLEPVGDVTNPFETTMRIAVLEAYESYNVPLYIAYHCKLFIQPAYAEGHYTSDSGIWWKDLATELDIAHNLRCRPRSESNLEVFSLRVMLTKNLNIANYQAYSVPNYIIHLLPPLILHNYLPYSLEIENVGLKQLIKIEPGEKKSVYSLDLNKDQKLVIKVKHNMLMWSGILNFTTYLDEKIVVLSSDVKEIKQLAINTKTEREGSCSVYFYTPYWIINKIGLPLQVRASATNTVYECTNEDILLFTYKRHGKQTLNVKVYDSNWSNDFGLECAGTTGLIICKDNERRKKYMLFLSIKLSQMCPRLTKIVTLLPGFLVTNNTKRNLRFMEHNEKTDLWIDIAPNQTVTFWPETSSMQMYLKYRDSKVISQAFNFATPNSTILRMDKGGGLKVEVSGGISYSFKITFQDYKLGDAPVLVRNYCPDLFLKIQQQEQSQVTLLSPYNSLLYTWDDPTKIRKLVWNVYNNKGSGFLIDVAKDAYGEEKILFHSVTPTTSITVSSSSDDSDSDSVKTSLNKKIRRDKIVIYWLCYMEGLQRVLVFTQESRICNTLLSNYFLEHCDTECLVSLCGIGLSLFTSEEAKKEHVYACCADTPAIWEVNVGHKWKTLTLELASWIEDKYRLHYKKCQLRDYVHIDFEKMYMLKPFFAELKRTYTPAVYFQVRKSKNYQHFNFKLNMLQVDNKISNNIVLYPLTTAAKGLNPFIDVNILKSSTKDCDVYRHIKINVKDFYLNIENDLFTEIKELMVQYKKLYDKTNISYVNDMKSIQDLSKDYAHDRSVIEYLSVNNFEIQLHISNKTQIALNGGNIPICKILNYLFPINISPYMPLEGVVHKITAIEQVYLTDHLETTLNNLMQQIFAQFLQQYYSHVLGLQVLVNTFAMQPAIMHPQIDLDKTANTVLYGSRCLLSHVNMSPAALEQCVIDIFANQSFENIQRIRRHGSYHKSELVPKIISASCRNFHCGVPNALNQLIVRRQNAGFNCDGEMFFRTTGKALYSLITRHPDEKSDSVEVAREALRRASILGEPIRIQHRLTRYYSRHLGLKPFSAYESMGQYLLETVANCRYLNDVYWSHAAIDKIGKSIILVSLQHVIRINKCRLWGPWDVEWAIDLDDIISMPKITSTELSFNLRPNENNVRELIIKITGDKQMLNWIHEKIEQAIIVSMEEKSWIITENP